MSDKLPNPFETARRRTDLITVALTVDDLIQAAPELSREDAELAMKRHGHSIANAMLVAGMRVAVLLTGRTTDEQ